MNCLAQKPFVPRNNSSLSKTPSSLELFRTIAPTRPLAGVPTAALFLALWKDSRDDEEVLWAGWQPLPFPKSLPQARTGGDREGFVPRSLVALLCFDL